MYITIVVKQVYWYISQVSGERLQDHWSSGSNGGITAYMCFCFRIFANNVFYSNYCKSTFSAAIYFRVVVIVVIFTEIYFCGLQNP